MAPEVLIFGGAGVVSLLAFMALILVPAMGSFGRAWEKATAAFVSLLILLILVAIGAAIGLIIVYNWDQINELL